MLLFRAGDRLALRAGPHGARLLLLGGAAMDGPRTCSGTSSPPAASGSSRPKPTGRPDASRKVAGDEREFIPLPEVRPPSDPQVSKGSPTS